MCSAGCTLKLAFHLYTCIVVWQCSVWQLYICIVVWQCSVWRVMGWTCGRLTPTLAGMRCLSTLQNILTPAPLVIIQEVQVGALASFQAPWVLASQLPIWSNTVELSEAQKYNGGPNERVPKENRLTTSISSFWRTLKSKSTLWYQIF